MPVEMILVTSSLIMAVGYDRFETCQRHKQGHSINIEASVSYSESHGGIFFVFVRDITERKRTEIILKKSRDQFMTFIQQAPIGIAVMVSNRKVCEAGS